LQQIASGISSTESTLQIYQTQRPTSVERNIYNIIATKSNLCAEEPYMSVTQSHPYVTDSHISATQPNLCKRALCLHNRVPSACKHPCTILHIIKANIRLVDASFQMWHCLTFFVSLCHNPAVIWGVDLLLTRLIHTIVPKK